MVRGARVGSGLLGLSAAVLAFTFAWNAVSTPFTESAAYGGTSDVVKSEALFVLTACLLGYAGWGFLAAAVGRQVRWAAVVCSLVFGLVAAPIAFLVAVAVYSGG